LIALIAAMALAGERPDAAELETDCTAGDGGACTALGLLLAEGISVPADRERATALLEAQCAADDARACRGVGLLLLDGQPPADDPEQGAALLERVCLEDDDWPACARVGDVLADSGRPDDALQYQARACTGGFLYGCSRMADAMMDPDKPWKTEDAVAALQDMCSKGEPYACERLDRDAIPRSGPAPRRKPR
jgi:TPR repeat protein